MYRLVAIDIDGTLLNSKKQVSQKNIDTVREATKKGINIVICTGRIFKSGSYYAKIIGVNGPLIACNGALIRDIESEELLFSSPLDLEDCYKIIDICHNENVYFHAYIDDTMYVERLEFDALEYWKYKRSIPEQHRYDINIVTDFGEVLREISKPVAKFVVVSDDVEHLFNVRSKVNAIEGVAVASSKSNNFEVFRKDVSKGNALKILSRKMCIDKKQIIAIGDNENDCSMIEYAGLGIAMGNAESIVKEAAADVTKDNDHSGVAEALKKYFGFL